MVSFSTDSRKDMRRLFVKGDIDGLFGLGLDNLVNLILMSSLCLGFLKFSNELFYGQILPGAAIGMIVGNAFYAWQAIRLAKREGRNDVCALPFGLNIIAVFVYVFLVMYPVQQKALVAGLPKEEADLLAWRGGSVAG